MVGDDRPTAVDDATRLEGSDPFGALGPGARVGKYEIVDVLGQGGFGITYRARDTQLDRDVAVKEYLPTSFARRHLDSTVLPRSTRAAEDFLWGRTRFLDEAKTLARLEGAPGIVNVHDFLEANGTAYMVMALVRGETLEARLKRDGRLPQAVVERFLHPLLDGLERVHAAGFLHRDIKPGNILLDADGRPCLIDFGSSRMALRGRGEAMTAVFTPGYAAIEQFTSAVEGPWTDIYALAGTLYRCVTGRVAPSALDRVRDDALVPAAEAGMGRYAPALLGAIDAGLTLEPADRPRGIAQWRRILSGADTASPPTRELAPDPVASTRVMDTPRPRRAGARRPPLAWIAMGVAALALAGGGAWLTARLTAPPTVEETLRRAEEESRRQVAIVARLREEEATRKAAVEERARLEAARLKADEDDKRRAAEETRRRAEAESARKAAEERAAAEAERRRADEEERVRAARRAALETERAAAVESERRREAEAAEEKAAAEAERRKVEDEERLRAARRAAAEVERAAAAESERRREAEAAETARRERDTQAAARQRAEDEAKRLAAMIVADQAKAPAATTSPFDGAWPGRFECSVTAQSQAHAYDVPAAVVDGILSWRMGTPGEPGYQTGLGTFRQDGAVTVTVQGIVSNPTAAGMARGQRYTFHLAGKIAAGELYLPGTSGNVEHCFLRLTRR